MHRRSLSFLAALLAAFFFSASLAPAEGDPVQGGNATRAHDSLRVITENNPPYNYQDAGVVKGVCADIVREVMRRTGNVRRMSVLPWSRGYALAQGGDPVALFSTVRMRKREHLFQWAGPLMDIEMAFFRRKGSGVEAHSLEEAKGYTVGVSSDYATYLYLKERGFPYIHADYGLDEDTAALPRLLESGRIDLWFEDPRSVEMKCRQAGVDPNLFERVYTATRRKLYVCFSMATPPGLVHRWQVALERMRKDGAFNAIVRAHGIEP